MLWQGWKEETYMYCRGRPIKARRKGTKSAGYKVNGIQQNHANRPYLLLWSRSQGTEQHRIHEPVSYLRATYDSWPSKQSPPLSILSWWRKLGVADSLAFLPLIDSVALQSPADWLRCCGRTPGFQKRREKGNPCRWTQSQFRAGWASSPVGWIMLSATEKLRAVGKGRRRRRCMIFLYN